MLVMFNPEAGGRIFFQYGCIFTSKEGGKKFLRKAESFLARKKAVYLPGTRVGPIINPEGVIKFIRKTDNS
jgi:hypothetical protein